MKRTILLLLCLSFTLLNAKTIEATYKISYGIFGELGMAKTTLEFFDNNTYKIKVHAFATGVAKVLSSGKEEFYESSGIVANKKLIPYKFTKYSQNSYKKRLKSYSFDYSNNKIILEKTTDRLQTTYDSNLKPEKTWKHESSKEETTFFASNDLLSLFFNIQQIVPNFEQGCHYDLKAIGAKNGDLKIFVPKGEEFNRLSSALQTDNTKFIASINQKIFSSKNGELYISLNKEGFCNKAVLKDVLIFGDIVGEMINFEIKES